MYTAEFAALYEQIGLARWSEQQAAHVLAWADEHFGRTTFSAPYRVLDLGCGTGAAARVFAAVGCDVVGIDHSAAMLEQARFAAYRQQRTLRFIQADIRALPATCPAPFDLITCLSGTLNEMTDDGDLARVCGQAARLLQPGGLFVFDIATVSGYRARHESERVLCNHRDYVAYEHLHYNKQSCMAARRIVWLVREIESWWRSEETHHERAWTREEAEHALDSQPGAALHIVACSDVLGDKPASTDPHHLAFYTCKTP
jgi:SAM-dependent methyltransferase